MMKSFTTRIIRRISDFLASHLEPFYSLKYGNKQKKKCIFFLTKFRFSCTNMITCIPMQSYNVPIILMFPFCVSSYGTD